MRIIQKFGGTSVVDEENVALKAIRAQGPVDHQGKGGNEVLVVVSARGKKTDDLIKLAHEVNERPDPREMDVLLATGEQESSALIAMAIHAEGRRAVSLSASQLGIHSSEIHRAGRIRSIDTGRTQRELGDGKIVVAAGFQGINDNNDVTTLGRGGSDTTAVALAVALDADKCEIYTDVKGVYTTDPRLVPHARRLPKISYDEMLELASSGAGVMHNRSIELAKKFNVPLVVRSSAPDHENDPGTLIGWESGSTSRGICGVAVVRKEACVTIRGIPYSPEATATLFRKIADRNVVVDMIVQNVPHSGMVDISFSVAYRDLTATTEAAEEALREIGVGRCFADNQFFSKLSIVGDGMDAAVSGESSRGIASTMFSAIAGGREDDHRLNIHAIATSDIRISVLIEDQEDGRYGRRALEMVHEAFALGEEPAITGVPVVQTEDRIATDFSRRNARRFLQNMESFLVEDIRVDRSQGCITLVDLEDRPGCAAEVFERLRTIANVDMIVQGGGNDELASLSFTVPSTTCARVADELKSKGYHVICEEQMAKIPVSGSGLRSDTHVTARVFAALAEAGTPIEMINTGEVSLSIGVSTEYCESAAAAIRHAFGIR
ncbi:MAG: aspartate kinase [Planctomycetia bacterium]|nr:aspartate kinase [Planctomycetia bacterium]